MRTPVLCSCGDASFFVRVDEPRCVVLVTCTEMRHHGLLLTSRARWHEVIQRGQPREARCRCGKRALAIQLEHGAHDSGEAVRGVDVILRCPACKVKRVAVTFDIDDARVDAAIAAPLDPLADARSKEP
jgi:hypothetical protein